MSYTGLGDRLRKLCKEYDDSHAVPVNHIQHHPAPHMPKCSGCLGADRSRASRDALENAGFFGTRAANLAAQMHEVLEMRGVADEADCQRASDVVLLVAEKFMEVYLSEL